MRSLLLAGCALLPAGAACAQTVNLGYGGYNANGITLSNGQIAPLQLDANGNLKVNVVVGGGGGGSSGGSSGTGGTVTQGAGASAWSNAWLTSIGNSSGANSSGNPLFATVSGTVSISGTPTVTLSGTPSVNATIQGTPSVSVSNFPSTQAVSGTVSVGNFPSTQAVSGSVSVSNLPATQPVSGSVSVSNLPATQPVSGTVSVGNFPATQAVSGTVGVSGTVTSAQPDVRTTGNTLSLTTAGNTSTPTPIANGEGTLGLTISGVTAGAAVLTPQFSDDGGNTWTNANMLGAGGVITTSISADGTYGARAGGHTSFRLLVATAGTGSAAFVTNLSVASSVVSLAAPVTQGAAGSTPWPVTVSGTPSVNATIQGTPNVAIPGTVTVNQASGSAAIALLPSVTYGAPAATTTSSTANTAVTLFTAGTITKQCFVQLPPGTTAGTTVTIDWGGGSYSSPVAPETLAVGQMATCAGIPTTAVTMWSSTPSVAIQGGRA